MAKQKITTIPVDSVHILNPRVRNTKIFQEIQDNIKHVGLKKPITVTPYHGKEHDKPYQLVCGQGRLEAFIAAKQKTIAAIVIDVNEEKALLMSLVENLARRQHHTLYLLEPLKDCTRTNIVFSILIDGFLVYK